MKNKAQIPNSHLESLGVLVGSWNTIGAHPLVPNIELHGQRTFEWIEGGAFLKMTSAIDHPQFPDGIGLFGSDNASRQIFMLYFDERSVSRKYEVSIGGNQWKWWRDSPEFSQRFTVIIESDGNTMTGKGEMRKEGSDWETDLELIYTRVKG